MTRRCYLAVEATPNVRLFGLANGFDFTYNKDIFQHGGSYIGNLPTFLVGHCERFDESPGADRSNGPPAFVAVGHLLYNIQRIDEHLADMIASVIALPTRFPLIGAQNSAEVSTPAALRAFLSEHTGKFLAHYFSD